jgi:LPS-assembly lipoprotein
MSLRSKLVVLCALLALTACGFQPVYGKKSAQQAASFPDVDVALNSRIKEDRDFQFALQSRLNPDGRAATTAIYRLEPQLIISETAIDVARDGTVSRYNLSLDSAYALYRIRDNALMAKGNIRQVSSYSNLVGAYYSTYIAKEDAIKRGLVELSEMYRQRLTPLLSSPDPQPLKEEKPAQAPDA